MIKVNKIKENIYQIRVMDLESKNFHGCLFPVEDGTSYACYLIIDDEITLIDTIDDIYFDDVIVEIQKILDGKKIDNIVINHVEPDHSASFELVKDLYPEAKVYTSKSGVKAMQAHFFKEHTYLPVGVNDEFSTGKYTFTFLDTSLVHWPDNMWTYLKEEKILFSNDGFGQLLVDDVVYDEEISLERLLDYSREYYANIIWPNNVNTGNALKKFDKLDWEIDLIAPGHGIMIKKHINEMIEQYREFVAAQTKKKALIVYDSIWSNTQTMSQVIKMELEKAGWEVKDYKLSDSRVSIIIKEAIDSQLFVIGSGNQNNCLLPTVADFLERLKASHFKNRDAVAFGSYGWAPVPFKNLTERLSEAGFNVLGDPIIVNYRPNDEEKAMVAQKLNELINN